MHAQAVPNRKPLLLFLALLVAGVLAERLVTQMAQFAATPALALGVTIDLVVGIPVLYYCCIVRPYRISPLTLTGVLAAAVALAAYILPVPQQYYLAWVQKSWVLAEPLLGLLLLYRLRRIGREYRRARAVQPDLALNLEAAFRAVFGNPLRALVAEIMMVRYGLFFWLRAPATTGLRFTMHRESAVVAILATLLLVTVAEAAAVHFLVARWSYAAALGLLVLSAYSLLFVVGHLAAVVQLPVRIADGQLHLRIGLLWSFSVPLAALTTAQLLRDPEAVPPGTLNLAKPLLTPPNVLLTARESFTACGIYGLRKHPQHLALYLDAPQDFLAALGG